MAAPCGATRKRFYGTVELAPISAKMDFLSIVVEVIVPFAARLGVDVTITVEVQANARDGFDESLQRTIKENCNVLRFGSAEFEGE